MNLLQLVDETYDSGIVRYALSLSEALRARGHAVFVGCRPNSFALREAGEHGLAVRGLPAGLLDVRRIARERKIELINAHTGSSHSLAVAAARLLKSPVAVVRTRGDSRPVNASRGAKLLWRATAGFIGATERIAGQLRKELPPEAALAAVLPGLDAPSLNGNALEEPPSPPLRVGLLGRLDPVKGHASFLRCAAAVLREVPRTRFLLAGREENVRADSLRKLARELGIEPSVELLGHVPDAWAFMRGCHVGVVASLGSEAVSRAAIEWMAAARPIVATDVGSLPELVADAATGFLVAPDSPQAMARRVRELLNSGELRARMGRAALVRFKERFSVERFAAETEALYRAALNRRDHA